MTDGRNFLDQPITNDIKTYDKRQNTTGCLFGCLYLRKTI